VKLRTEFKLLVLISLILTVSFSVVNFISVNSYRSQLLQKVKSEADLYQVLLLYSEDFPMPEYFKLSPELPPDYETWNIVGKVRGKFLLLNVKEVNKQIYKYMISLFVWEIPALILTVFIVYRTVNHFIKREKETKELVKLFFLLFSHKLGNFLSLDRLSIELLLQKYGQDKPLLRLKRSYQIIEEDFKKSLKYIEALEVEREPEMVELSSIVKELLMKYHNYFPDKEVEVSLLPIRVKAKKADVESVLQLLIENAFKYSKNFIKVEASQQGKFYTLTFTNDVGNISSGSGIGLKMIEFLIRRLGWGMKIHPSDDKFIVELKIY